MTTPFRSGRTEAQGFRPFVLEGDVLYVPPERFHRARCEEIDPRHSSPIAADRALLRALGFTDGEVDGFIGCRRTLRLVVDYDLKP